MRIKLSYPLMLSELTENRLAPNDRLIEHVCTDSRLLKSGDLFIALKGANCDGNKFTDYALKHGAIVISEHENASIQVENTDEFIVRFISIYKSKISSLRKTIAITGSVGKTSAKTVLSTILSTQSRVHSTYENQNNLLGTLYTVLKTPKDTEMLILELGMNHQGEISMLSRAVKPDIAIITNIGTAHIGNLGSREMIAKAKLEITDGLNNGILIIPYNEPLLSDYKSSIRLSFDSDYDADICFSKKHGEKESDIYTFIHVKSKCEVRIKGNDKRLQYAIGFALSVCSLLNLDMDLVANEASKIENWGFRQKVIDKNGYQIYDDTYSSSPEAVLYVVDYLLKENAKISCVLADMLELGEFSNELHVKLGTELAKRGIDKLYLFGPRAKYISIGIENSKSKISVFINDNINSPETTVRQIKKTYTGEILLVKGSRNTHTERIIDLLTK